MPTAMVVQREIENQLNLLMIGFAFLPPIIRLPIGEK
jgi:hypothetical protein